MKYLYYLLIFFQFSCHYQKTENKQEKELEGNTNLLRAEIFYPNEIFDVIKISSIGDFFVITSVKADTLIHIYGDSPLTLKSSFGKKGEGPLDLMLPILCNTTSDKAIIGGFDRLSTFITYTFDGNNFVLHEKYKIPQNGNPMNDIAFIDSTRLIFNDIFDLQLKSLDLNNNKQKLLREFEKDDHRESFFYSNKGHLAVSSESMAYAYSYKDQIDFMDLNGKVIHVVKKDNRKPSITIDPNADNKYYYANIFATKNFYYALYRNKTTNEFIKGQYKGDVIEVYNNEGTLVRTYSFDISPIIYAVDQNDKRMVGFNAQKEALLIYDLP